MARGRRVDIMRGVPGYLWGISKYFAYQAITYLHDLRPERRGMYSPTQSCLLWEVASFAGPGSSSNLLQRAPPETPSEIRLFLLYRSQKMQVGFDHRQADLELGYSSLATSSHSQHYLTSKTTCLSSHPRSSVYHDRWKPKPACT
jgi:hypothetical protein